MGWIIDSGAIDYMTFDLDDFLSTTQPRLTRIANTNGVTYRMIGVGTVALSWSLSLPNTLLVPPLSNKLMSVGQDIHTKEIIGLCIKRGGRYYVDDFSTDMANNSFHKHIETQFSAKIQISLSDNGGEYVNHDFQTSRQMALSMRPLVSKHTYAPRHNWDDAIVTTVYLLNRMPSRVLDFRTPVQMLAQNGPLPFV
ncbi:unnamed protein product [Prunus armeniaca]